tara:strand:- start:288 stop:1463 length:1176 start_codon:yes stop_codon:yes gene_type:complete
MAQVGNKNIDNASGQVVRLDIQNTLAAVASNNFGAKASAGEIQPAEFVADSSTTPKKLLIRATSGNSAAASATFYEVGNLDEANLGLLPKAGGTMTGALLGDDASGAGSPAYAFDGDTDTGMFRSGANSLGFSTAGTQRFSVSDSGLDITDGLPLRFQDSSGAPFVSLKSPSSLAGNVSLTLPATDGNAGEFLQTDGSGVLSFSVVTGVPSGAVFCMAVATIPSGYLECNGQTVNRTTYAALFAVIGTQYGAGNGSTTFEVPDLRGEFIRGFDNGKGTDSGRSIGTAQAAAFGQHQHSVDLTTSNKSLTGTLSVASATMAQNPGTATGVFSKTGNQSAVGAPSGGSGQASNLAIDASHDHTVTGNTGNQGSTSNSNETRPRNIAMMYIIKV